VDARSLLLRELNTQFTSNRNLTKASYAGVVGPSQDLINNAFEPFAQKRSLFMKNLEIIT
jgi:hypothetical protein